MRLLLTLLLAGHWGTLPALAAWNDPPDQQTGAFWRLHWFQPGLTNGNPSFQGRFRVNAPEASLSPSTATRVEARENGMMLIRADEDPRLVTTAELYLELWGGHPGTANKRVTINGRSTYPLPEVGTALKHCTYSYPAVQLKQSDLVNGFNACQFAVDQGETFWGHAILDNACLRVALTNQHPALRELNLDGFTAAVRAELRPGEQVHLQLLAAPDHLHRVDRVVYQGWYNGYDENGDGLAHDWHGFTFKREPRAMLGQSATPPFNAVWNVSMVPAQREIGIRALVYFKGHPELVYTSPTLCGMEIPERPDATVRIIHPAQLPVPFWSRAGQRKACTIGLDLEPATIEQAQLHVIAWTGGPGTIKDYFKLNGRHYPVAEGSKHELVYTVAPVIPDHLRSGANTLELLSDTEHHGIEICLPGPAFVLRVRR